MQLIPVTLGEILRAKGLVALIVRGTKVRARGLRDQSRLFEKASLLNYLAIGGSEVWSIFSPIRPGLLPSYHLFVAFDADTLKCP